MLLRCFSRRNSHYLLQRLLIPTAILEKRIHVNVYVWVRVHLMILLYLDCDIAFPSPAFARAGDGAAHGA